jgi:acyl-CoA synthetase (AMP-forming)/AMP-acid ligase II
MSDHIVLRSPYPDVQIPASTIPGEVLRHAGAWGSKPALIDAATGECVSYAQLGSSVHGVAAGLHARGVGPGAVVGLISHNQPSLAIALLGVLLTGGAVTPLSPLLTPGEIAGILRASGASMLITAEPVAVNAREAANEVGVPVLSLGSGPGPAAFAELEGVTGWSPPVIDPGVSLAILPFSSGTTGHPKGVMLTHRNIVANLAQLSAVQGIAADEVFCAFLPMFHIYGLTVILFGGLRAGVTLVTMPRFELTTMLGIVQDFRVTRLHVAPPIVLELAQAPEVDHYDLSSLRSISSGAAPLDDALSERAGSRIGCRIGQGYGLTETSPGISYVPHDDVDRIPLGTVGRLLPNTEVRLVDPASGADSAERGELWVRGPQVMRGYLSEADTAAAFEGDWFRTGDLATVDDGGVFRIVGRLKELIKFNGYQVAPAELESLLVSHPSVADAAVVGVADLRAGEIPKAFVVAKRPVEGQELMDWLADQVAPYKKVRELEFVERIPRSPTGKILRRLLVGG